MIMMIAFCMFGCTPRTERELNNAIEAYRNNENGACERIEKAIIMKVMEKEFNSHIITANNRIAYVVENSNIIVKYPFERVVKIKYADAIKHISISKNAVIYSDGSFVKVMNSQYKKGKVIYTKKDAIQAVWTGTDSFIFFSNGNVYYMDKTNESPSLLLKESFNSPYPKYYNVRLTYKNGRLCIVIGVAGIYYCSMIDIETKKVLFKNLPSSAARYAIVGNKFYYLEGSTGQWNLNRYDITKKSKKKIDTFKSLHDIQILSTGYIFKTNKELYISNYDQLYVIPYKYTIVDTVGDYIIMHYANRTYIIPFAKLYKEIHTVQSIIPNACVK